MKIELRKIRINTRMSEETTCFSADIYLDGKLAGEAMNRGHGGETEIRLANVDRVKATQHARAWITANDPKGLEYITPDQPGGYAADPLAWLIDGLVEADLKRKEDAKTAKIEAKNAQGFAAKGIPWMVRVTTAGKIAWYGLKSCDQAAIERVLIMAKTAHGAITAHAVVPTGAK